MVLFTALVDFHCFHGFIVHPFGIDFNALTFGHESHCE